MSEVSSFYHHIFNILVQSLKQSENNVRAFFLEYQLCCQCLIKKRPWVWKHTTFKDCIKICTSNHFDNRFCFIFEKLIPYSDVCVCFLKKLLKRTWYRIHNHAVSFLLKFNWMLFMNYTKKSAVCLHFLLIICSNFMSV